MIERDGERLLVKASLLMANARGLLDAGRAAMRPGEQIFDFSQVSEADSSALVVMLGWLRSAPAAQASIRFAHIPTGVLSLAELYGLTELLPLA
ncbi:STAS domain-containing protein [Azonexus sp.]|jgi:phospholipid transport system transporter-binding protein|uniref:STAS domain-containing protein n=1 Tax=Azonexus sp. TaxID=1872668 RepID=UPI00283A8426|nr:STAS domain-containing protein [Azonexus sp.]MDR1996285.1 STAS domain-containing protein [Azonexus sp.]